MIAFPIKSNSNNAILSPSFGKAKYFAFYDGEKIKVLQNNTKDGMELIDWLVDNNVTSIIIKEIGSNPYKSTQENNIKVYYCEDKEIKADEVIKKINNNQLNLLNNNQIKKIIEKHEHKHTNGKHNIDLEKLIFPTNENKGIQSTMGAYFGKAKFYIIVTLSKNVIADIKTIENSELNNSECENAISGIMDLSPSAVIISDIGSSPAKGFLDIGLNVYLDSNSKDIKQSIEKYIKKALLKATFN